MGMQEAVRLVEAGPDSQDRVRACRCGAGGEWVAYALIGSDKKWRAVCMGCGAESEWAETMHGAQMEWNFGRCEG